ncbi:hypothetical protein QF036_000400 [Arthrobacter globiformis]|nr:hypothetical protein [Arthrobacter globiformis]
MWPRWTSSSQKCRRRPVHQIVHNGIEYGLMQAYAKGYQLLTVRPLRIA